jgi:hypothetical protein
MEDSVRGETTFESDVLNELKIIDDKNNQIITDLYYGTESRVYIYASPGTGKTAFRDRMLIERGIIIVKTDSLRRDGPPDNEELHMSGFRAELAYQPVIGLIIDGTFLGSIWYTYLLRLGIDTIGVMIDENVSHPQIGEEVDENFLDVVVNDFKYVVDAPFGLQLPIHDLKSYGIPRLEGRRLSGLSIDSHKYALTISQYIATQCFDELSNTKLKELPNLSKPLYELNKIVFIDKMELPLFRYPTAASGTTIHVKGIVSLIAKLQGWSDTVPRDIRRLAIAQRGRPFSVELNPTVSSHIGNVKYRGRDIPLCVSGHMVNILLASNWIMQDMDLTLAHIEWNWSKFESRKLDNNEKLLLKNGGFYERVSKDNIFSLWHNYWEYDLAIDTYLIIANSLGLRADTTKVNALRDNLKILSRTYVKAASAKCSVFI